MQQTVDVAVKETKDLDLETIPAYGLFYFYSAAADAATDLAATTTAVAMDSEMAAANPSKKFRLV